MTRFASKARTPEVELLGYAHSWCREEPQQPGNVAYMRGWTDGIADKRRRDRLRVKPSLAKTKPKPRDDQKIFLHTKATAARGSPGLQGEPSPQGVSPRLE